MMDEDIDEILSLDGTENLATGGGVDSKPRPGRLRDETVTAKEEEEAKPKFGRRAGRAAVAASGKDLLLTTSISIDEDDGDDNAGGKSASEHGRHGRRGRRGSTTRTIEDLTADAPTEVPYIPDLETLHKEDLTAEVARAPTMSHINRVVPYQDLQKSGGNDKAEERGLGPDGLLMAVGDIPIGLLHRFVTPVAATREADTHWTWGSLMKDISTAAASSNSSNSIPQR